MNKFAQHYLTCKTAASPIDFNAIEPFPSPMRTEDNNRIGQMTDVREKINQGQRKMIDQVTGQIASPSLDPAAQPSSGLLSPQGLIGKHLPAGIRSRLIPARPAPAPVPSLSFSPTSAENMDYAEKRVSQASGLVQDLKSTARAKGLPAPVREAPEIGKVDTSPVTMANYLRFKTKSPALDLRGSMPQQAPVAAAPVAKPSFRNGLAMNKGASFAQHYLTVFQKRAGFLSDNGAMMLGTTAVGAGLGALAGGKEHRLRGALLGGAGGLAAGGLAGVTGSIGHATGYRQGADETNDKNWNEVEQFVADKTNVEMMHTMAGKHDPSPNGPTLDDLYRMTRMKLHDPNWTKAVRPDFFPPK